MTLYLKKHRDRAAGRTRIPTTAPPPPAIPPYPTGRFSGRGIVTSAGGKYQCCAYVLFRLLRHVGCSLPIECWYLGDGERDERFEQLCKPLGVTFVDAISRGYKLTDAQPAFECDRSGNPGVYLPGAINGYGVKAFAVLNSSFKEVLWLDADVAPASDPTPLFSESDYSITGARFWPDRTDRRLTEKACKAFGVGQVDVNLREFDSGVMLANKELCWNAIAWAAHYSQHRDYFYRFSWGDKDTFQFAWSKAAKEYSHSPNMEVRGGIFVQHSPASFPLLPLFWHRVMGHKYSLDGPNEAHGFPLHDVAIRAVEEFRRWKDSDQYERDMRSLVKAAAKHGIGPNGNALVRRQIRIAAYDRPHYLRRVVDHLKRCRGLERWQIVASIDQRPDGTHNPEVVAICREVTGDVRLRSRLGCNAHTHTNLSELAAESEWGFLLEDDIVLSREALEWCIAHEALLVDPPADLVYRDRNTELEIVGDGPPHSMCLIGRKVESSTERLEESAVYNYFCAWGMYFSRVGLQRALEVWRSDWNERPEMTWDCYLSDSHWRQLMPVVPRAKNIGKIGAHCRSEQDYHDADRQHWVDDGPATWCFLIHGPDQKDYLIHHALRSHAAAFDRVVVLSKGHPFVPRPGLANVEVVQLDCQGRYDKPYYHMLSVTKPGDWICYLDADEALSDGLLDLVRSKSFGDVDAYDVSPFDRTWDSKTETMHGGFHQGFTKRLLHKRTANLGVSLFHGCHCSLQDATAKHEKLPEPHWYWHRKTTTEAMYGWISHALLWPEGHDIEPGTPMGHAVESLRARWQYDETSLNELLLGNDSTWWQDLRRLGDFDHKIGKAIAEYCDLYGHQREGFPLSVQHSIKAAIVPWPAAKPDLPFDDFGWLLPEVRERLLQYAPRAGLIVELGSYLGLSTRLLLENSTAEVIAVDTWLGGFELYDLHHCFQGRREKLFEQFTANCWDWRERLHVIRDTTSSALRWLHKQGVQPDLIYVDASHQAEEVCLDVTLCRRFFPRATIVGDDWGWETVRAGIALAGLTPTLTEGNCWMYLPCV